MSENDNIDLQFFKFALEEMNSHIPVVTSNEIPMIHLEPSLSMVKRRWHIHMLQPQIQL